MKRLCKPQIIESVANYIVTEIEKKKLIIAKKT